MAEDVYVDAGNAQPEPIFPVEPNCGGQQIPQPAGAPELSQSGVGSYVRQRGERHVPRASKSLSTSRA